MKKGTKMDMPGIMEEMFNIIEEHADVVGAKAEPLMKAVYGQFPMKGHSEYTLADVFFPSAEFWAMRADISDMKVGQVYKKNALLKKLNYLPVQYGKGMSDDSLEAYLKYLRWRGVRMEKVEGRNGYYQVESVYEDGIPHTEVFGDEMTPAIAFAGDYIARKSKNGKWDKINYGVASIPNMMDDIQPTLKKMAKENTYTSFFTGEMASFNRNYFVRGGFEKYDSVGLLKLEGPRFVLVDNNGNYHRNDELSSLANYAFADELLESQRKGNYFRMPKRKYHLLQKMRRYPGLENIAEYYVERTGSVNHDYTFSALTEEEKTFYAVEAHKLVLEHLKTRLEYHETCADKKKCAPERDCITFREYYEMYVALLEQRYPEYFCVASATA